MVFIVTLDKAIYLDLVLKIASKVCLWLAQNITKLANKKQNPKVEWHVFLLLAQLVSKTHIICGHHFTFGIGCLLVKYYWCNVVYVWQLANVLPHNCRIIVAN
jgi:hypothetical protein